MTLPDQVDWSECALVEINPRVQSGVPVLAGTRMPVDAIINNFEFGLGITDYCSIG